MTEICATDLTISGWRSDTDSQRMSGDVYLPSQWAADCPLVGRAAIAASTHAGLAIDYTVLNASSSSAAAGAFKCVNDVAVFARALQNGINAKSSTR